MNNTLIQSARRLRLSGLLCSLEVRLHEATTHQLPHAQFLELVFQDELNIREQRLIEKRKKWASFRDAKTLEEFDWSFNTGIKRQQLYELATGNFIRQHRDLLVMGPPGVGKSHLVQALGYHAIKAGFLVLYRSIFDLVRELQSDETPAQQNRTLARYLKPDLIVIDDFGMKQLPPKSGEALMEIVLRRHENRSTVMTSNRPIEEWGRLLNDVPAATAILDRFLHRAEVITIAGRSYRLQGKTQASEPKEKKKSPVPLDSTAGGAS